MRVLLCFRSPVGGLFRHVRDLASGLNSRGVGVGALFSSDESVTYDVVGKFGASCQLGIMRCPILRSPGLTDVKNLWEIQKFVASSGFDIVHGHGAKGGYYARALKFLNGNKLQSVYTLHGGSLHYSPDKISGVCFAWMERKLRMLTDGVIFESEFAREKYWKMVGAPVCRNQVVYNGLCRDDFVTFSSSDKPFDFIFLGELRWLKGVDILISAVQLLAETGRPPTVAIFGAGPDEEEFKRQLKASGLNAIQFMGPVNDARTAFSVGRCVVVPSRAESLPYVVLEAIAAGLPVIASDVGAMSEIIDGHFPLVRADCVEELASTMRSFLDIPGHFEKMIVQARLEVSKRFDVDSMVEEILAFYCSLSNRH